MSSTGGEAALTDAWPLAGAVARLRGAALAAALIAAAWPAGMARADHLFLDGHPQKQRIKQDFDRPTEANHHITDSFSVGAELELDFRGRFDHDLDANADDRRLTLTPMVSLSASYAPNPTLRAFLELEISRDFLLDHPTRNDADGDVAVEEAYITLRDLIADGVALTIGRHDFGDKREWLLGTELDGVRIMPRGQEFAFEAAIARKELLKRSLFADFVDEQPDIYYFRGYAALGQESMASAYALFEDGRQKDRDVNLAFLGLSSHGELAADTEYWAEAAAVIGREDGRDVRGYGFDLGVTRIFRDAPWRPAATLAVAFGSGDDGSGTDSAFRQSGLQGNEASFAGKTDFQYYGELLDPELSNLLVLTAGLGVRPTPESSVDLVYHHYLQHHAANELRDSNLDADPSGASRNIGGEIDLIVLIPLADGLKTELVGGAFLPGSAFDGGANDPAFFTGFKLKYEF